MYTTELFEKYENFKEKTLSKRRFKHKDILPLIEKLKFSKEEVGRSFEGRKIQKVKIGNGPRKILLWSQMHGNEATATMAIFDIFNFFESKNDGFDKFKSYILQNLELHFVPMLNPDGAERFIRRTAQGIDMNRDALALKCPESKILKDLVESLKPEFSFNLHDQNTRYSAGKSPKQASISFLATAYNEDCDWNENRIKARQTISAMNEVLQEFIPNGIGRFSDEFEPRAFGDNIQKWGSSLILIESGGFPNDPEKQFLRKLNFVTILSGLYSIAANSILEYSLSDYLTIPQNEKYLFDLKILNATMLKNEKAYTVEVGINIEEKNIAQASDFINTSVIDDIGDLSVFWGIQTLDANGGVLKPISEYPEIIEKHKLAKYPEEVLEGESASFVLDLGEKQILILNGSIVA
ncbi:peptidase M14 [Lacihabitans sp. LS3-19]|uniref:M14 family metallopeptidase n=1 Tax=Lacihabitans sp. LS3-19 TaxID=2487335 RepID=UPI0020CD6A34|nr:M14 metallopeptidase family protein [Lacihabitans sp. LS3-19]MCP9766645.1 peptidase M14 [Lacihabitans sp. LS3-19]